MFTAMRDNVWHNIPLLGGMWGGRTDAIPDIADRLDDVRQRGKLLLGRSFA